MRHYLVKRLLLFIPSLFLVSLIVFTVMRIIPGDPVLLLLLGDDGEGTFTQEAYDNLARELGMDRSLVEQYVVWISDFARGDMGDSIFFETPVVDDIKERFPVTLELALLAMVIAIGIAVPLGVVSAVRQDTWVDYGSKLFTVAGVAAPTFWLAILLLVLLAKVFHWLPPLQYADLWEDPLTNLKQLIFPALALGFHNLAFIGRFTRSAMLEVLREDFIRTAHSKGLSAGTVIFRHGLKNAVLPVITVAGLQLGALMGGVVLVESIFLVPGTGRLLIAGIQHRDFPTIQAVVMLGAIVVLVVNLAVDLLYAWLDPRVRYA